MLKSKSLSSALMVRILGSTATTFPWDYRGPAPRVEETAAHDVAVAKGKMRLEMPSEAAAVVHVIWQPSSCWWQFYFSELVSME